MATAAPSRARSSFRELIIYPDKLQRLTLVSGIAVLVAGLCTVCLCPWLIKISFSPTPHLDVWAILHDISGGHKWYSLSWLWKQHNEHRVPLLRLMIYADLDWLGGHEYLLYTLTFLTLLLQWIVWAAFLRSAAALPKAIWISVTGFLAFCFFCPNQYQNFYLAIQWTFVAEFFFSSAAFIALGWFAYKEKPWRAVSVSAVAAFLGECSLANGVLIWPILWLSSLMLPMRRRHRVTLVVVGALATELYTYHYWQPPYHSNPLETIRQPLHLAHYVTRYIDTSLSAYFVNSGFAAILLSLLAFSALAFLLHRPETRMVGVVLTASMCFVLATAAMTGLGRLTLGIAQAGDSRYETPVMLYWGCAFTALMIAAWQLGSWRDILTLNTAAVLAIFVPIGNLKPLFEIVRARADIVSLKGQALDQGVDDPLAEEKRIYFAIVIVSRYLHAHGLKVGPEAPHVSNATVMSGWNKAGCQGWFDSVTSLSRFEPGPAEVRADGWAVNRRTRRPVDAVAIIDNTGAVLAETSLHFDRLDVLARQTGVKGRVGWRIYVPLSKDSQQLQAVAILDGHGCPLSNSIPVTGPEK